jgi:hypothetical protein
MTGRENSMGNLEAVRTQLRELAGQLGNLEAVLKQLVASLRPDDSMPQEEDAATEIRAVVECVLLDSIGPAKRDLMAAAEYSGNEDTYARGEGEGW